MAQPIKSSDRIALSHTATNLLQDTQDSNITKQLAHAGILPFGANAGPECIELVTQPRQDGPSMDRRQPQLGAVPVPDCQYELVRAAGLHEP